MLVFLIFAFRLTVITSLSITDNMKLIDVNGNSHEFTSYHINMMMAVGWVCFILAWILNIVYYFLHPSAVDFKLSTFNQKLKIPVFGRTVWDLSNIQKRTATPEVSPQEYIPQEIVVENSNSLSQVEMTDPPINNEQNNLSESTPIRTITENSSDEDYETYV